MEMGCKLEIVWNSLEIAWKFVEVGNGMENVWK